MSKKKTTSTEYEVTHSREIDGTFRKAGETVQLRPAQAKYYLPPYGTGLKALDVAPPVPKSPDDKTGKSNTAKS